jgi:hypothetical protein
VRRTPRAVALAAACAALLSACGGGTSSAAVTQTVDVRAWVPSAKNPDPSTTIDGVVVVKFPGGKHIRASQRVAYKHSPPMGGTHDQAWAACNGVVYPDPVRSENLVHSMEHGAVWIAYDPDKITGKAVDVLAARVEDKPYMVMSPYPGMKSPISVQSWGHQLALTDPADPRIDQFVAALRQNSNTYPEPGASCDEVGAPYFEKDDPPPFAPAPTAKQVDGKAVVAE